MRIISKFRDYYDSVRAMGFDPNIVYVRKTEELKLTSNEQKLLERRCLSRSSSLYLEHITISFCGEIHRGLKISENVSTAPYSVDYGYVWSLDKLHRAFPQITKYFSRFKYAWAINEIQLKDYFEIKPGSADLHIKYKSPVITYKIGVAGRQAFFEKDSCLREIDFQQVYDPFTAFQKLAIFVGNVLVDQGKIPWPIPDKLKAQSKGFDDYSFRKRPQH